MITIVTGGSGSGKSEYAESLLSGTGASYIATMQVRDGESRLRVRRHREKRAGKGFVTQELPTDIRRAKGENLLIECMSNLLANEMFLNGLSGNEACEKIISDVIFLKQGHKNIVIVTNEVFSDGDAANADYIRSLGRINAALAAEADNVVEVVFGIPVIRKGRLG